MLVICLKGAGHGAVERDLNTKVLRVQEYLARFKCVAPPDSWRRNLLLGLSQYRCLTR